MKCTRAAGFCSKVRHEIIVLKGLNRRAPRYRPTLAYVVNSLFQVMKKIGFILILALFSMSCATVKPYEKAYLNDEEMQLSAKSMERFETNFQVYREAAAGANGGKSGGGCGCN